MNCREIIGLDIGTGDRGSGIVYIRTSATDRSPVSAANTKLVWARMQENDRILSALRLAERSGGPTKFVFEGISSYGKAVGKSTFRTLLWIGRMFEAIEGRAPRDPEPVIVLRRVVAAHLVGVRRKGDPTMDSMIKLALAERFGGMGATIREATGLKKTPGPLYGVKSDMWSALAVAVAFAEGAESETP